MGMARFETKIDQAMIEEALRRRAAGESFRAMAPRLGVSFSRLARVVKRHEEQLAEERRARETAKRNERRDRQLGIERGDLTPAPAANPPAPAVAPIRGRVELPPDGRVAFAFGFERASQVFTDLWWSHEGMVDYLHKAGRLLQPPDAPSPVCRLPGDLDDGFEYVVVLNTEYDSDVRRIGKVVRSQRAARGGDAVMEARGYVLTGRRVIGDNTGALDSA